LDGCGSGWPIWIGKANEITKISSFLRFVLQCKNIKFKDISNIFGLKIIFKEENGQSCRAYSEDNCENN
jgi:hypothetical protein